MKTYIWLILSLICISSVVSAQTEVIKVWNGEIPGAIKNADYVMQVDTNRHHRRTSKVTDPTLSFYPVENATATTPAVVVCPGGGYIVLADGHEGVDVAEWLNSIGITAVILRYRLPSDNIMEDKSVGPLQDVQEAIRVVRRNAAKWNIDPAKIGIMGFSAGGHLASTASTHYNEKVYEPIDSTSARPDFSVLVYPVVTFKPDFTHKGSKNRLIGENASQEQIERFSNELQVTNDTPPAFLVHSIDDRVVPVENSINYALAMKKHKRSCELHIYENGGHGYGLGRNTGTKVLWPNALEKWLTEHQILNK